MVCTEVIEKVSFLLFKVKTELTDLACIFRTFPETFQISHTSSQLLALRNVTTGEHVSDGDEFKTDFVKDISPLPFYDIYWKFVIFCNTHFYDERNTLQSTLK